MRSVIKEMPQAESEMQYILWKRPVLAVFPKNLNHFYFNPIFFILFFFLFFQVSHSNATCVIRGKIKDARIPSVAKIHRIN